MRADWDARAREDAHYYVAFGRRDQNEAEFLSTAADVLRELEKELKRFPVSQPPSARRALEIGCGPGRLLRPMSRHFGEIHGIDVSPEMIAQARTRLADLPSAHLHATTGSDLSLFAENHFDFVYSYAVFQHIPSAEIVFSYLRETVRVMKPGGFAHLHINGLPKTSRAYTTWEGARISADEIRAFTREQAIDLLSLTGVDTQYMWTTWRKPHSTRIRSIANAFSSEQAVPATGRLACAAFSVENLPDACDLNSLTALFDGVPGIICYIGPRAQNDLTQVNAFLPPGIRTGLVPASLLFAGRRLCPARVVRVIPPGPAVPRLVALTDAVDLLSPTRIESGMIKATVEEAPSLTDFRATIACIPVEHFDTFRTDPLAERHEINFSVPAAVPSGPALLELQLGRRTLARVIIEVIR
jgi:ubiquinone/menaquinone biosynthesis C-methylase UbiE